MTKQTKNSISTLSGQFFDPLNPEDYTYNIDEIATALSNLCRYTGHVNSFYSVAEHSVLVSRSVPDTHRLAALLHDASEAYLGDMARPVKQLFPRYKQLEESCQKEIFKQFNLDWPMHESIHEADMRVYWQERQEIANVGLRDNIWAQKFRAARKVEAQGMSPKMARRMFMSEYNKLTKEHNVRETVQ